MRARRPHLTTTATAAALFSMAAIAGTTGCRNDRVTADARRTLGTQLGSTPVAGAIAPDQRQSASADDLAAARRYLEATLRLDPTNDGARAALAGLGGPTDANDPSLANLLAMPGPVAARATGRSTGASFGDVTLGTVGALTSDVAAAVRPLANAPAAMAVGSTSDSAGSITALVTPDRPPAESRADRTSHPHSAATRRRGALELETAVAARADSADLQDAARSADSARPAVAVKPAKHKRTWPWTRAQRWLVAKGIGGGAGAGVVVGAIVGNVPGALIAGSLTGGALGFHKATKIGPAAPYPSKADSVAFDENKRRRDAEKSKKAPADTSARVAVARP
ncbi:MAG TPA: hypothetical protein VGD56_02430 [Gemmatirosa sp.]